MVIIKLLTEAKDWIIMSKYRSLLMVYHGLVDIAPLIGCFVFVLLLFSII